MFSQSLLMELPFLLHCSQRPAHVTVASNLSEQSMEPQALCGVMDQSSQAPDCVSVCVDLHQAACVLPPQHLHSLLVTD